MKKDWKTCHHIRFKIRKHKTNPDPCIHCLDCGATWSSGRGMYWMRRFKEIRGVEHKKEEYEKESKVALSNGAIAPNGFHRLRFHGIERLGESRWE